MVVLTSEKFGRTKADQDVTRYTFTNSNGMKVEVLTFGGIISVIEVPDRSGKIADVALGYDTLQEYEVNPPYLGALIGRVANRIAGGKFELDGQEYTLVINNGPNHIHGGTIGFSKVVWKDEIVDDTTLKLTYTSVDGEEGYPGEVKVTATYRLTEDNEIIIDYKATSSKATPINLTNHSYFNLSGHGTKDVYDHVTTIHADKFTPKNDVGIPTGEIASVSGTVFDLRKPIKLGEHINEIPGDLGYDHNFCVNEPSEKAVCARVEHPDSGRVLEVLTNQLGVQLYTANYLDGLEGKGGATYPKHSAFCFETQNYPNSINTPSFPDRGVLRPGETYHHICTYKFSATK